MKTVKSFSVILASGKRGFARLAYPLVPGFPGGVKNAVHELQVHRAMNRQASDATKEKQAGLEREAAQAGKEDQRRV
jgi:hypothetical protein